MLSYCGLNLHFSNVYWWESFLMLIYHPYVFFGETSVQKCVCFKNGFCIFFLLSFESFYIFWILVNRHVHNLQIFFPVFGALYFFLYIQVAVWYHRPPAWWTSFNISCRVDLQAMNSTGFYLLHRCFSPSVWKLFSQVIGFWLSGSI